MRPTTAFMRLSWLRMGRSKMEKRRWKSTRSSRLVVLSSSSVENFFFFDFCRAWRGE